MKATEYEGDLERQRRVTATWRVAAFGAIGANVLLAGWLAGMDTDPMTHIVPPGAQRTYWINRQESDPVLYEEMTRTLSSLLLTANPQSAAANVNEVLRFVEPVAHDTLRRQFERRVEYLRKHGYSTVFYPQKFHYRRNQVAVTGQYIVFAGGHAAPGTTKTWLFSYTWRDGALWLDALRETSPRDPFGKSGEVVDSEGT